MSTNKPNEWSESHVNDLIARGFLRYKAFELIDKRGLSPDERRATREALGDIVEAMYQQRLRHDKAMLGNVQALLELKCEETSPIFRAWTETLKACASAHKAAELVCSRFSFIACRVPGPLQARFFSLAPQFPTQYGNASFGLMSIIADTLASIGSDDGGAVCLDLVERYMPVASPETLAAIVRLGATCHRKGQVRNLDQFVKVCTPAEVKRDRYCEPFVVAYARGVDDTPSSITPKYVDLCMIAARSSFGSASYVASRVPRMVRALKADAQGAYVDSILRIVRSVGICSVGFCSKRLLCLFKRKGNAAGLSLTGVICRIADDYGSSAAMAFIDRSTPTSRKYSRTDSG
jgi:hypothetical protein